MPPAPPILALRDASVTFGGAPLFSGISLGIARGERVCLVGANGVGKSTILNSLTGSDILAEDRLFATLDPTSRRLYLSPDQSAILTDTRSFCSSRSG